MSNETHDLYNRIAKLENEQIEYLSKRSFDLQSELTEVNNKLKAISPSDYYHVAHKTQSTDYGRHKPETTLITGTIMFPSDCTCGFSGSCLGYCNPYK